MKYLLTLLICCITVIASAQNGDEDFAGAGIWRIPSIPTQNGAIVYSDTIILTGYMQKRLLANTKDWVKYNLDKEGKQISVDTAKGNIMGSSSITYKQGTMRGDAARQIQFRYTVTATSGGYSYKFTDIMAVGGNTNITFNDMYNEAKSRGQQNGKWTARERYETLSDLHSYMTLLIAGLREAMLK